MFKFPCSQPRIPNLISPLFPDKSANILSILSLYSIDFVLLILHCLSIIICYQRKIACNFLEFPLFPFVKCSFEILQLKFDTEVFVQDFVKYFLTMIIFCFIFYHLESMMIKTFRRKIIDSITNSFLNFDCIPPLCKYRPFL